MGRRPPMAQPPGSATRATPVRARSGPSTTTDARMVDTSSYGASWLATRFTWSRVAPPGSTDVSAPSFSRSLRMVTTSAKAGTFSSITGWAVSRLAAMAGRAAFLAALTWTSPRSGVPPSMTRRAGISSPPSGRPYP